MWISTSMAVILTSATTMQAPWRRHERSPFYWHILVLIPAWISDYIHYNVCGEITYLFPNFNGATVEVWEWINNLIPHITGSMIN